jgi:hypothetical protein
MRNTIIAAVLLASTAAAAADPAVSIETLKQQEFTANSYCRGGKPGPETERACDKRDRLIKAIEARGYCYKRVETQTSTEDTWVKCSMRPSGKPSAAAGAGTADLVYACNMGDREAMFLNLAKHKFHFVDHEGALNEGLNFGFTTKAGYFVSMDLGDPDRLHDKKPRRVRGWGSVTSPTGVHGKLESILCVRTR